MVAAADDPGIATLDDVVLAYLVEVAILSIWPIFILFWFRRASVREQVDGW